MSRILVSLGGNALGTDFDELVESVGVVAKPIVGLIQAGHEIVICHGNGPQVGMIKSSIDHGRASYQQSLVPLSEAVAMSQAYVGYHLQNAIENQLHAHGIQKTVCTVISRALVDADDPMFQRPTKPIDAVIDKDYASVLLAADTACDAMAILTGVEKVSINFNTPDQQDLDELTVAHAEKYLAEGQFPEGSMLPKIRAALRFTTSGPGRKTLITSLDKLVEGLNGQTGTWIVP